MVNAETLKAALRALHSIGAYGLIVHAANRDEALGLVREAVSETSSDVSIIDNHLEDERINRLVDLRTFDLTGGAQNPVVVITSDDSFPRNEQLSNRFVHFW